MAEAVTSVLVTLAGILREKVHELKAVRGQIEQVQKDLRLIEALLKDVDSKCTRNNVVTEWLDQVSEIANRIAAVIETFRDKIEENHAESSNWSTKKFTKAYKHYKTYMFGLHDELKDIIEELNRLYRRRTDLRIEDLGALDDVDDPEPCDDVDDPEAVGLEDDHANIIEQLLDSSISRRTVLSIVGTGGLGKSTLAQKVYNRCLIQVTKKSWNGYCKYCSIHDLLRDLAIRKAKDENFFTVFSKEEDVNNLAASKPCRATLQFCTPTDDGIFSKNTRSLLCFGFGQNSSNNSGFGLLNYSGFGQLQVLTLERVNMTTFTRRQWSKGLINLRYLGLRDCFIPHDIFKKFSFPNLETIDLYRSEVDSVNETLDLCDDVIPTLRHVYGSGNWEIHLPLKWNKHKNLQTIMGVDIHIKSVVELGFCINLRMFGIVIDDLDDGRAIKEWENLKSVLKNTVQLVHLSIGSWGVLPFGGTKDLPCHGKIQKLDLSGEWERNICVPSVEMFPTNLTKLELRNSNLQEDPMPVLERLQSLRILYLYRCSYVGTELICSTGGFPNLEKLKLDRLDNLHHWDIKEGAMPILRRLQIYYCEKLHVLPELQKVRTLQELRVYGPSDELREGMQMQRKDVHKIKDIPSVRIRDNGEEEEEEEEKEDDEEDEEKEEEEEDMP